MTMKTNTSPLSSDWQTAALRLFVSVMMLTLGAAPARAQLFDIEMPRVSVVVHPQSVVHSMVEFVDGSIIAQLSTPDMCLP